MKKIKPEIVEERLANTFSLPKDIAMGLFQINMLGNRECIIENYRGIILCDSQCIRLQGKKQILEIDGKKLTISYYTETDMKICGYINSITFQ